MRGCVVPGQSKKVVDAVSGEQGTVVGEVEGYAGGIFGGCGNEVGIGV